MRVVALTATDANPRYLECAPYFESFWRAAQSRNDSIKYVPHIALVRTDDDTRVGTAESPHVIRIRGDISTAFAAQCIRLVLPHTLDADFVVTSDVDMFPLDLRVIEAGLDAARSTPGGIVVVRDVLPSGEFPICYTVAAPEVWAKIVSGNPTEWLEHLWDDPARTEYDGVHGGAGWFTDQEILFRTITQAEEHGVPVIRLADSQTRHRRLDRAHHPLMLGPVWLALVGLGYFTDYHVHFPVGKHRLFLNSLLRALRFRARSRSRYFGRNPGLGRGRVHDRR